MRWKEFKERLSAEMHWSLRVIAWIYGMTGLLMLLVALIGALFGSTPLLMLASLPMLLFAAIGGWGSSRLSRSSSS